jgi:hypothetical protein
MKPKLDKSLSGRPLFGKGIFEGAVRSRKSIT